MASWLKEEICISLHYLYFKMLFLLQLWKTEDVCLSCARNCSRSSHHIVRHQMLVMPESPEKTTVHISEWLWVTCSSFHLEPLGWLFAPEEG